MMPYGAVFRIASWIGDFGIRGFAQAKRPGWSAMHLLWIMSGREEILLPSWIRPRKRTRSPCRASGVNGNVCRTGRTAAVYLFRFPCALPCVRMPFWRAKHADIWRDSMAELRCRTWRKARAPPRPAPDTTTMKSIGLLAGDSSALMRTTRGANEWPVRRSWSSWNTGMFILPS